MRGPGRFTPDTCTVLHFLSFQLASAMLGLRAALLAATARGAQSRHDDADSGAGARAGDVALRCGSFMVHLRSEDLLVVRPILTSVRCQALSRAAIIKSNLLRRGRMGGEAETDTAVTAQAGASAIVSRRARQRPTAFREAPVTHKKEARDKYLALFLDENSENGE